MVHAFLSVGLLTVGLVSAQRYVNPNIPMEDIVPALTKAPLLPRASATGACAEVSASQAETRKATAVATILKVPADTAYECLTSVPLDVQGGLELIDGLKAYWQWQSTTAYLKEPTSDWDNPKVDIFQELDDIAANLKSGQHKNEYHFQLALTDLANKAHDFHFVWNSDIGSVFQFHRGYTLIAVSEDCLALPKIYIYAITARRHRWHRYQYLRNLMAFDGTYHDSDARYNNLFYNPASTASSGSSPLFTFSHKFPGAVTKFEFENGTAVSNKNQAYVEKSFEAVDSGEAFFKAFFVGHPSYVVAGYFFNSTKHEDGAVLSITSFLPPKNDLSGFTNAVTMFFDECRKTNKSKLIIDPRGNGGGELFPGMEPYGASRLHASEALDAISSTISANFTDINSEKVPDYLKREFGFFARYSYKEALNENGTDFSFWKDYYGPHEFHGDRFTSLASSKPTAPLLPATATLPPSPFDADDILLVTDGLCGSTCTLFHEFMHTQAGVHTLTFGGRPQTGPMQSQGGSRGALLLPLDQILRLASRIFPLGSAQQQADWNKTSIGTILSNEAPVSRCLRMGNGLLGCAVNARDNIRCGDNSQTPLEFTYEAADCRLFYTAEMYSDAEEVWKGAYDAKWNGKSCVEGSMGDASSLAKTHPWGKAGGLVD
ncbi:hypothetical protein EJ06DRAFT_522458 [Trichodelitschia bisporula]|uniref:CPAF-like PDZ domain-containing protein n=1 Tax=Trichodelitschia bisporula TaxID=703511 RepID=A0A6G1HUA7_9PEZI|nr:hypothetical protein EJ06DRAFT_522458 [Trichodelitschia bisporula]